MTDRETLCAAAQAVASVMRRRQAEHQVRTDGGWVEPDPDLLELVVECEDVIYSRRPEAPDLTDRLAAVLGVLEYYHLLKDNAEVSSPKGWPWRHSEVGSGRVGAR